ncbi:MAG: helix-turn-helix transcriptional regulator, partial [Caldilineaceae bacterium]|nr:helix-turn-helix transcriptional regulator [Caldilineaceae bacterium]
MRVPSCSPVHKPHRSVQTIDERARSFVTAEAPVIPCCRQQAQIQPLTKPQTHDKIRTLFRKEECMTEDLSPRARRHQRTHDAILDAARQIINEQGTDALSMRAIAKAIDY